MVSLSMDDEDIADMILGHSLNKLFGSGWEVTIRRANPKFHRIIVELDRVHPVMSGKNHFEVSQVDLDAAVNWALQTIEENK